MLSKLGAGGRIAAGELKRSAPDGKTLLVSASSIFTTYPNIYTKLDYDPVADFTPVAGLTWFDVGLCTGPATGATDFRQLMAWAKGRQDFTFGASPGNGSSSHFTGLALGIASGVKTTFVPYKEGPPAMGDIVTGRLPAFITGTGTLAELHRAGKLRIVATSGDERSPLTPEVPTFKESGVNVTIINTAGLYAPAKMPPELVQRIHAALAPIFARADLPGRLMAQGMAPRFTTGPQLAASLEQDRKHYAELVKASGYVPEAS
ncbi:MAG: ABC transporter substrate-binding protein [Comamonadaceae bacterium]|nr:MAG: ABC transporter substrate-binding protein [Comamonadaceae bacterium]